MQPDWLLYLITDRHACGSRSLVDVVAAALRGGVRAVQLREKDLASRELLSLASDLRALTAQSGARLLINRRIDVMQAVGADGVHLPQDGLPPSVVRRLVGPDKLIGVSTHSVKDVQRASEAGANFVTFGPVYDTPSKRAYGPPVGLAALEAVCRRSSLPVFAIGGIDSSRIAPVMAAGAHGVAMISAIISQRDVSAAVLACNGVLQRALSRRAVDPHPGGCYN